MLTEVAQDKLHVHELVERLAPNQVTAVRGLLEVMLESSTVVDDEPVTEEDRRRISNGKAWFAMRGGKGIPMDDVLAEFGLTTQDFPINK